MGESNLNDLASCHVYNIPLVGRGIIWIRLSIESWDVSLNGSSVALRDGHG